LLLVREGHVRAVLAHAITPLERIAPGLLAEARRNDRRLEYPEKVSLR
jgi:hypothetical protein